MGKKALFNQFISIVSEDMARHVLKESLLLEEKKKIIFRTARANYVLD